MSLRNFFILVFVATVAHVIEGSSAAKAGGDLVPPPSSHSYNWTGIYAGASAGFLEMPADVTPLTGTLAPYSITIDGGIFGLQAGANYQTGRVVLGIEGDVSWGDVEGSKRVSATTIADSEMDWFATVRGRIGITTGNILFYATGGWAASSVLGVFRNVPPSDTQTHSGWTAGGGAEVLISDRISLKAEGLHYDLDDEVYVASGGRSNSDPDGYLVRAGINLHF